MFCHPSRPSTRFSLPVATLNRSDGALGAAPFGVADPGSLGIPAAAVAGVGNGAIPSV